MKPPPSRGLLLVCYRFRLRRRYDQADFRQRIYRVIGGAIVGTNGGELLGEIAWQSKWVVTLKTSH